MDNFLQEQNKSMNKMRDKSENTDVIDISTINSFDDLPDDWKEQINEMIDNALDDRSNNDL